ncbi:CARDB domain-containing protein [Paenibacillus nasutitermitis]|nr:CARDB domain-containing protein [Paenibacillus nasutitermitis]
MNSTYNIEGIDYDADNSLGYPVQGRTYVLESLTTWSAQTYVLNFEIEVTYTSSDITTLTDLIADEIIPSGTIEVNKTTTFRAQFHNVGPAINTPYNLKVMDELGNTVYLTSRSTTPQNSGILEISFTYTFTNSNTKTFRFIVDSANAITETRKDNNEVSRSFKPGDTPPPDPGDKNFTGDFDVLPGTISYRDSFTLHPKDFQLQGCTYISHSFKIQRGLTWIGPDVVGQAKDSTYTYNTYPSIIGVGTHQVSMKITTSCGEKWVGPKTLTVTGPAQNNPPQFQIAFVDPSRPTVPVHEVIEGTTLNLVVIQDPSVPTPMDPDGDSIYFDEFFFSSSESPWIKSLPAKYTVVPWGMYNIKMDTSGIHQVSAQIHDVWGLSTQASTYITVRPENPIPVARCPATVIENHVVPASAFDASASYSPVPGRSINHGRDEWTNKLTSYTNGTDHDITVQVSLHVYDTKGLKSVSPSTCEIIVKPDLPPIAKLDVPPLGIRNEPTVILNKSSSPDGDQIVKAEYKYKYDANNNGFADDAWQPITGRLDKLTINPDKVGKYLFYVKVTEEFGQWGDTSKTAEATLTLDVVNNAPEVSFEVEGKNPQPDLDPSTTIRPEVMMNWPVYITNDTQEVYNKNNLWQPSGGSLISGEGRNFGNQRSYPYIEYNSFTTWYDAFDLSDNGYGNNRLSPWRAAESFNPALSDLVIGKDNIHVLFYETNKIRSNKKTIYFDEYNYQNNKIVSSTIYALDPSKLSEQETYGTGGSLLYRYRNGSPYTYFKTFSLPTNWGGAVEWEFADRYIYVANARTMTVLDARTGNQLATKSFADMGLDVVNDYGNWYISHANGSKLMLRRDNFTKTASSSTQWREISPDLTVKQLRDWSIPSPRASLSGMDMKYTVARTLFTDPAGAIYTYEGYDSQGSNFHHYRDMNVTKYNPDMTLAWRTYLTAASTSGYTGQDLNGGGPSNQRFNGLAINPIKNEITVSDYNQVSVNGETAYSIINTNSGTIKSRTLYNGTQDSPYRYGANGATVYTLDWAGNYVAGQNRSMTADGYQTNTSTGKSNTCGSSPIEVFNPSGTRTSQVNLCNWGTNGGQWISEYVGDGVLAYVQFEANRGYALGLAKGTPTTTPLVKKTFTSGQFVSDLSLNDVEMKFSLRMEDVGYDREMTGFSFRMQDTRNRYALETDGHMFNLMKYVNGSAILLKAGSYPFESNKSYAVKIKTVGDQIDVFLNNIPLLTAADGSYAEGRFGYFSDKSFVTFSAFTYKAVQNKIEWSDSYAIWDEGTATADVIYKNILFMDPEGDPKAGSYRWNIQHTPRFINNQGVSAKNGQTFNSEQLTFDKVGDYIVTLQAKDDPNPSYPYPNMTFDAYRKNSNAFGKKVTVHRRPVSQFTVVPGAGGKLIWTDSSFDPDRYLSPTNYSTEPSTIDYRVTRGVIEKKFYYQTPSGNIVFEKLVTPQERGYYEIGMAVKDEYGAWSDYTVVSLDISTIPTPNTPPVPGFTTSYMNTYRSVPVVIDSTAYDAEDGGRENLPHEYYIRNVTTGDGESLQSTSRTFWTKVFNTLGTFNIRQVVQDSTGVEAQFNRQVNIVNRLPVAQITVPGSTDQNNPTKLKEFRPAFDWSYQDADGDVQTRYQLQIFKYGGLLYRDTDIKPGNIRSWRPADDLPEHVYMYVKVRAYDGYDWGNWSDPKYFYIETNQPPTANFDWTPKPVYEGDTVQIRHTIDDPDLDTLQVSYVVKDPDGGSQTFASVLNSPYPQSGPTFRTVKVGTYKVELTVLDGKAPPVTVHKDIPVLPLAVYGQVRHTDLWDQRRKEYNTKQSGSANSPRGYEVFWAGEKFVLNAQTTETGTATQAVAVKVTMNGFISQLDAADLRRTGWSGSLWDESFEKLADGPLTFAFTSTYNNGTKKTANVTVTIAGNVQQTVGVHRRQ